MKLKKEFIHYISHPESLHISVYGIRFHGLVLPRDYVVQTILKLLKYDTTEAEIVAGLSARCLYPEDIIAPSVHKAISSLREIGAIDE